MSNNCSAKFEKNKEHVKLELCMKDSYIRENADSEQAGDLLNFTISALTHGFAQSIFKYTEESMTDDCVGEARHLVLRKAWRAMQDSLDEQLASAMKNHGCDESDDEEGDPDEEGLRKLFGSLQKFSELLKEVNKK